jgi:MFS family permease
LRRLLSIRDARLYLAGQTLSILGDSALWLAAGIWVKVLTHSSALAGLTFFFFVAPSLASPLSGMLVDRVRRRPLLLVTNLGTGAMVLLLLLVHGRGQVWLIWVVMVLYGLSYTVLGSAQSALLTVFVPDDLLGDANGALRTVREGLRLVAPLLGAGLFAAVGGGAVALLDSATFGAAAVSLALLRVKEPRGRHAPEHHWASEVSAGFRHVWRTTVLRQMTLACGAVLLVVGFAETLGFAVVAQGLHRPPTFLGVIVAIQGLGAVVGGPTAAPVMRRVGEGVLAALGMLALAAGALLWALPSLAGVGLGSVMVGFSLPWLVVGAYTLVQRRTPPELQGRTYSAFDVAVSTPQTISIAIGAGLVALVPYQALLGIMAAVVALAGGWLLSRPEQRQLGRPRSGPAVVPGGPAVVPGGPAELGTGPQSAAQG